MCKSRSQRRKAECALSVHFHMKVRCRALHRWVGAEEDMGEYDPELRDPHLMQLRIKKKQEYSEEQLERGVQLLEEGVGEASGQTGTNVGTL
jgi:hypothetical protein